MNYSINRTYVLYLFLTFFGFLESEEFFSTVNSNLIKVEPKEITVTTVANQNAIGGYYAFIGSINPTKGKKIAVIPIGSVRTDKNGIGGVICKYHSSESGVDTFTLNASSAAEYRCDFICLYTE